MKKAKKIIIPVLFTVALLTVTIVLYFTGFFEFSFKPVQSSFYETYYNNEENMSPAAITLNNINKYSLPDNMSGVWLDLDNDIGEIKNYDDFINEIASDFDYFRNFRCNTIFIKPDTENKFSSMKNSDGISLDSLACTISYAKAAEYKIYLIADDSILLKKDKLSYKNIEEYLSKYSFDGILLSSELCKNNSNFEKAIDLISTNLKSKNSNMAFGVVFDTDINSKYIDEYSVKVLQSRNFDFACINTDRPVGVKKESYKQLMGWWNELAAAIPEIVFYGIHRADLVGSDKDGWDNFYEVADEVKILAEMEHFYGNLYYSTYAIKKNKAGSQRLSGLIYDGFGSEFSVQSLKLVAETNTVNFTGKASKGTKLFNDHEILDADGGKFDLDIPLKAGQNVIKLKNRNNVLTYNIYDNSKLIISHSTEDELKAINNKINVYAVCRNDSFVTAELDDNVLILSPSADILTDTAPNGYSLYACSVNLDEYPFYKQEIGNLILKCYNGNRSEEESCGIVYNNLSNNSFVNKALTFIDSIVSHKEDKAINEKTVDTFSVYEDHGLGTALMCRITEDRTEQLSTVEDHDTYHSDYSTLMKDTLDYVNGISLSEEGLIRYELNSGISVYAKNCELIYNAYVIPENSIKVASVDDSESDNTKVIIDTSWIVPVNAKVEPQEYYQGSADYSFNVKSFTAEYLDVVFYHTASFDKNDNIVFDDNSAIKSYELFSEGNCTKLRLYFKEKGRFFGFNISHNDNGQIVLSIKKRISNSLENKIIMLDAGHGGLYMTGTALNDQSIAEKTVTLSVAQKAKMILEQKGAKVIMTRNSDVSYDLEDRVAMCNKETPDIYVSIHADGSGNLLSNGTHTLYFRAYSQPLAACIHRNLVKNYSDNIYSPDDPNYLNIDRKIQYYPYFVTRIDTCPSVLTEIGFMTNEKEGKLLSDDNVRSWIADGIANGIEEYFLCKY